MMDERLGLGYVRGKKREEGRRESGTGRGNSKRQGPRRIHIASVGPKEGGGKTPSADARAGEVR